MTAANLKKKIFAPPVKLEQTGVDGKLCLVYSTGNAARFRALGRDFEKTFPRRTGAVAGESAVEAVRAIRDGRV